MKRRLRSALSATMVTAVTLLLTIGLAELALRLSHYGEERITDVAGFCEYDPFLGWQHKRNYVHVVSASEYHTTLSYDAQGLRGTSWPYAKPSGVSRVVVIGDSFVDGYMVDVKDRLTEVLQSRIGPGFQVVNLGVAAYSTDQELLLMDREGWKYQPDAVVLAFYYNDVWMNGQDHVGGQTHKPTFVLDENGGLSLTNVPVPPPKAQPENRFKLYALIRKAIKSSPRLYSLFVKVGLGQAVLPDELHPAPGGAAGDSVQFSIYRKDGTPATERTWKITEALLARMKNQTEEHGARFIVFYVPTRVELSPEEWAKSRIPADYDAGEVSARLKGICHSQKIVCIEPSDRFREAAQRTPLYYSHDPHWNAAGQRLAGEILGEYFARLSPDYRAN
jgi:hypothetical protein